MEGTCFEVSSYCVDKKHREQFDQTLSLQIMLI